MAGPWQDYAPPQGAPAPASVGPWTDYAPGAGATPPIGTPGAIDPITGKPYQSVGNIPAGDVVGQATDKPIQEGREPGVGTQAIASLPTDPDQRVRVVAKQLFPNLQPKDAQARIFFGPNGRMAAVGFDGKPFYVDPAPYAPDPMAPTLGSMVSSFVPSAGNVASLAGPSLPAVGGAVGGVVAGPTSLVAGPIGAGLGAAGGDLARQGLAQYFDPGSQPINFGQTASEAGGAAVGQLAGAGLLRFFSPNALSSRLVDRGALDAAIGDANRTNQLAQGMNVRLTPGQVSGIPSLVAAEDAITSGSATPAAANTARNFYTAQRNELMTAFDQHVLDRISSAANKTDAAMQFQQGAEDATRIVRQQANAAARPAYQAAEQGGQVMSPDLAQLADTPAVRMAMDAARRDYPNFYNGAAPDTPNFQLWQMTKEKLDDMVSEAQRQGANRNAAGLGDIRTRLVANLDAAYPTYDAARATAAPGQRLATRLESITGPAIGDGTERAGSIVNPVFNTNNPRAIEEARNAFTQAGRQDEWNAGVRAYLQDAIDRTVKSQNGLNPSMLRSQIWSDPNTRAAMQAAMTPEQFQGLDNFMSVLEAAARSHGLNSLTAPRAASAAELKAVAEQGGAGATRLAGEMAENLTNPFKAFGAGPLAKAGFTALADRMNARGLQGITDRLFSPDGMLFLQQMAQQSPLTRKAITASSEFLGQQQVPALVGPRRSP